VGTRDAEWRQDLAWVKHQIAEIEAGGGKPGRRGGR
jgi:hypothetical protein